MFSARRVDVLYSINKENYFQSLTNFQRLRGKILSVLEQEIIKHTITMCRRMLCNWNMKQARDFHTDKANCSRSSLRKQIKLLKISEKTW